MGTLRLILALSVVFAHSPYLGGLVFVGGRNAVQLFYVISGFLISYIINKNNNYRNIVKFYLSRGLRLYPIYYIVSLLSLPIYIILNPEFFHIYKNIPVLAQAFLTITNIILFGQDWVMFSGIKHHDLVFVTNFSKSDFLLYKGLLVPQAWTLGVELTFYLVAPFILKDRYKIIILLLLSLSIRFILIKIGIGFNDPWNYRFFPTELSLFLLGALSQQLLLPFWEKQVTRYNFRIEIAATIFLIIISVLFFIVPMKDLQKSAILFALFIPILPLAFIFQNNNPVDKLIGNLSYPIYIGHFLVIQIVTYVSKLYLFQNSAYITLTNVVITIAFAIALERVVARPVEAFRDKIKTTGKSISMPITVSS